MKNTKTTSHCLKLAVLSGVIVTTSAHAATYIGSGKWEVPANWDTGRVPGDNGAGGLEQQNIIVLNDSDILFDADTWTYLDANSLLHSSTEYRGALRLLMGENTSGSTNGTHSLTFDHGGTNLVNITTGSSQAVGSRAGKDSTLNIFSGTVDIGGNPFNIAGAGNGTVNISGGSLVAGRSAPNLGTGAGTGVMNITGGSFTTRAGLTIGGNGTFSVSGAAATEVGLGSAGNLDGEYIHEAGGVLAIGIDGSSDGVRKLIVADNGEGTVQASIASGAILDMSFFGIAETAGTWTILELENADIVDNGLVLAGTDAADGWSYEIDNTGSNGILTATFTPIPEPSVALLGGLALLGLGSRRRRK